MQAALPLPAYPQRQRRQGSGWAAARSLPPPPQRASVGVFHGFPFHGTSPTATCCEIRFLVLHTYPDGIKAVRSGDDEQRPLSVVAPQEPISQVDDRLIELGWVALADLAPVLFDRRLGSHNLTSLRWCSGTRM